MNLEEYASYDGTGLAALVSSGEITASELAELAFAAINKLNPSINAVVAQYPERANPERAAELTNGPFNGVPFLVKDLVIHEAAKGCSQGSRLVDGYMYEHSSDLMQRFIDAGFNTLGRTASPELGMNTTTENVLHGPTLNPWDPSRMAGGSSGGSAACVASGILPIAHGNDGGGSIRIPASCCGVFGLKPTRLRTPVGPDVREGLSGFGVEHVISRTVRDSAAVLDLVQGPGLGDPYIIPPPEQPYLNELEKSPGQLRIAFTAKSPSGVAADTEVVVSLGETVVMLQDLGHIVEEASPMWDHETVVMATVRASAIATAEAVNHYCKVTGRTPSPDTLESVTLAFYEYGMRMKATEYFEMLAKINNMCRDIAPFFEQFDLLLTPTLLKLPQPIGTYNQNEPGLDPYQWIDKIRGFSGFPSVFNVTGQPAMSVPLHHSKDGLPIGMQFAAKFADEATLFRIAKQLEDAHPWVDRRPSIRV